MVGCSEETVTWTSYVFTAAFFFQMPRHKVSGNIDLNVHVLTMGHWPTYTPMEIQLPAEVRLLLYYSTHTLY